jgi:hypothetical protein
MKHKENKMLLSSVNIKVFAVEEERKSANFQHKQTNKKQIVNKT